MGGTVHVTCMGDASEVLVAWTGDACSVRGAWEVHPMGLLRAWKACGTFDVHLTFAVGMGFCQPRRS